VQQAAKAGSSCPCDFLDADVIRGSEEQMPRLLSIVNPESSYAQRARFYP
jgi:hypothetical protein